MLLFVFFSHHIKPTTEGDSVCLIATSYCFGFKITTVLPKLANQWGEIRYRWVTQTWIWFVSSNKCCTLSLSLCMQFYRHQQRLKKADIVVIFNGRNHYSGASECNFYARLVYTCSGSFEPILIRLHPFQFVRARMTPDIRNLAPLSLKKLPPSPGIFLIVWTTRILILSSQSHLQPKG